VKLQKCVARVITFSNWRESSAPLLNRLKWSLFTDRLKFDTVKYIFKASHRMASDNAKNFFERKKRINKRIGEDELTLVLPNAKQNFLRNTIFYNSVIIWNELPFDMTNMSYINFIKSVKVRYNLFQLFIILFHYF
jgi:hypothetical protein